MCLLGSVTRKRASPCGRSCLLRECAFDASRAPRCGACWRQMRCHNEPAHAGVKPHHPAQPIKSYLFQFSRGGRGPPQHRFTSKAALNNSPKIPGAEVEWRSKRKRRWLQCVSAGTINRSMSRLCPASAPNVPAAQTAVALSDHQLNLRKYRQLFNMFEVLRDQSISSMAVAPNSSLDISPNCDGAFSNSGRLYSSSGNSTVRDFQMNRFACASYGAAFQGRLGPTSRRRLSVSGKWKTEMLNWFARAVSGHDVSAQFCDFNRYQPVITSFAVR